MEWVWLPIGVVAVLVVLALRWLRPHGLSFLSVGPRIAKQDGKLVATTSWPVLLLTLFLLRRTVVVDPKQRMIRIRRRSCWLFLRQQSIPFKRVRSVTYSYEDMNPFTEFGLAGDTFDAYSVKLRLHSGKEVDLFQFPGEGEFSNRLRVLPDWFYWDEYLTDLTGTQATASKRYVELLQKLLQVPLTYAKGNESNLCRGYQP